MRTAVVLVLCGMLAAAGCTAGRHTASPPRQQWRVGDCVRPSPATRYVPTGCDDRRADARIVAVLGGRRTPAEPACAATADGVIAAARTVVCVRDLRPPHPGDPGMGGGLIGPGDCIVLKAGGGSRRGVEVPCRGHSWYGRVIARASTAAGCPTGRAAAAGDRGQQATWATARGHDALPAVLCLGRGGRVLAPGDCVGGGTAPHRVACRSSDAGSVVVALTHARRSCPHVSRRFLVAPGGYLPVACLAPIGHRAGS